METDENLIPKDLQVDVEKAVALERELAANLQAAKSIQEQLDNFWAAVKKGMIDNDIKKISDEKWGSLTIGERLNFKVDLEELPRGYKKLVADTKKIADHYKLTGKVVKGAEPSTTKYLLRRLK